MGAGTASHSSASASVAVGATQEVPDALRSQARKLLNGLSPFALSADSADVDEPQELRTCACIVAEVAEHFAGHH